MLVKLAEGYNQSYWDSGTGFTIAKGETKELGRVFNIPIKLALNQGILEIVPEKGRILDDTIDESKVIKEVVSKENDKQIEAVKENLGEKNG